MTEEEKEQQYIKAFNNGYVLEKHEPRLLADILKSVDKAKPYFQALQAGQRQFQKDKFLENRKQIEQDRDKSKELERE